MSTPIIAFFNNREGIGKTSLVYHLAWMYTELGKRVVVADLDPQANLTIAFLDEEQLEPLWLDSDSPHSIFGSVLPLIGGTGDIAPPYLELIDDGLALLVGDMALSGVEDELSGVWPKCLDTNSHAFRVMSAFWRLMQQAADMHQADLLLMDLGPNLSAINRAALIAADHVVVPLAPDLLSLQGLRHLGPTLRRWRAEWQERLKKNSVEGLSLPPGHMHPVGYIVLQHSVRLDRPVQAYERWMGCMPTVYRSALLGKSGKHNTSIADDPHCLALLKSHRSLIPLAQEIRKPMFQLKPADGALGSHLQAVQRAYHDFEALAREIVERTTIQVL
ncbi:MAG: cobyrinic acid a,c-diamide synthase [Candidatus Entotheonella factor]|uniref:Cobyrinic acid a,c-diamide synthase n=1 Tax=Entotheonella factor TaxID=1429438 RepID=W4LC73_ENTF1|nr:MAG: cobyrinic acid a,c-diamide synthase [Candidatus Entotheonella factor]